MRTFDLRPGERRATAAAFATLAAFMAGHAVLETARDTLFLSGLPARRLPWAYLAIAVLAIAAARLGQRAHERVPRRALGASLVLAAGFTVLGWLVLPTPGPAALIGLYVWTGLVSTVVVIQFWLRVGRIFTASQARRVYPIVASGGLTGAIGGSALAVRLVSVASPALLPAAAAGLFAVAALASGSLPGGDAPATAPSPRRRARGELRAVVSEAYARRLLGILFATTVTVTIVDYLFKDLVWRVVPTAQLGWFFSWFYTALNILALVLQLVLAPKLFRGAGVHASLALVPTALGLAATGFGVSALVLGTATAATFWAGAALKVLDGATRHSITRTGLELLYMPLGRRARESVKTSVDVLGQRGGQAAASLALLAVAAAGARPAHLAAAVLCGAVLWLLGVLRSRRPYVELFRTRLQEGSMSPRAEIPELDLESLEEIVASLSAREDSRVIAAVDLLEEYGKLDIVPSLMIFHPSRAVALHAFDAFARTTRPDVAEAAERLLDHEDPDIRAAALRAHASVAPSPDLLRAALDDPSGAVRTTALVCLMARGFTTEAEASDQIRCILDGSCADTRLALAQAVQHLPADRHGWVHRALARTGDPLVSLATARSMQAQPHPSFLPELIAMLPQQRLRAAARRALLAIGPDAAVPALAERLAEASTPRTLRRHLPRTLSRFQDERAAAVLLEQLTVERDPAIVHKLLRGLGRMKARDPGLPLDRRVLLDRVDVELRRAIEHLDRQVALDGELADEDPGEGGRLLLDLFREREGVALERVFRLLHLLRPGEDFRAIHSALTSDDRRAGSASRELLEHVVEPALDSGTRAAILALVEDLAPAERLELALPFHRPTEQGRPYQERLAAMISSDDELLRGIAAYHAGERHLEALRSSLTTAGPRRSGFGALVERGLALMDRSRPKEVAGAS